VRTVGVAAFGAVRRMPRSGAGAAILGARLHTGVLVPEGRGILHVRVSRRCAGDGQADCRIPPGRIPRRAVRLRHGRGRALLRGHVRV